MTKFSDMDNATLRRRIAERLGYTVVPEDNGYGFAGYEVLAPDGEDFDWWGKTVELAWDKAFDNDYPWHIPGWPEDVGAALALPMPYVMRVEMVRYPYDANYVTLDVRREYNGVKVALTFDGECDGGPDKLARAICLAWAAMMQADAEAQSEGGGSDGQA